VVVAAAGFVEVDIDDDDVVAAAERLSQACTCVLDQLNRPVTMK